MMCRYLCFVERTFPILRHVSLLLVTALAAATPAILGLSILGLSGCAHVSSAWSLSLDEEEEPSHGLPAQKTSPDVVVVETVLVRVPKHSQAELEGIWRLTDETILSIEQRELLDRNGLRAGVLLSELPKLLRDRLESTGLAQNTDALEHAGLAADSDNRMRQLQCRSGRRKELPVRRESTEPVTILTTEDGQHISGRTFDRAAALFDLRAIPKGDGSATIELTPEIQYGQARQSYVSTEFGIRPAMKRDQQVWENLSVKVNLKPGQVFAFSGVMPPRALGKAFFVTETADGAEEHVVLLLRIAETRLDELFAPELMNQARAMAER